MNILNKRRPVLLALSIILPFFAFSLTSCKKFIEVTAPATSTNAANVYADDATAIAVLTGIYGKMSSPLMSTGGIPSLSLFAGLSADEFTLYKAATGPISFYYSNALTNSNTGTTDFWTSFYPYIFYANSALEGVNNSNSLTPAVKQQLIGEAEFVRAFCYFYLVNLYGDVPLSLQTDFETTSLLPRASKSEVYDKIVSDLRDAENKLSDHFLDATLLQATDARVRPTRWAAAALLSRAYLYSQKWDSAVAEASKLIGNSSQFSLDTLKGVFLKGSPEAIWQLQPVGFAIKNTQDAFLFIIPSTGLSNLHPVYISPQLLNAFETGDLRRNNWVDSVNIQSSLYYFPYKYKNNVLNSSATEYETVMRLGEQYLIRAEAEAHLNQTQKALTDLNSVRIRAGLTGLTLNTQDEIVKAILHERQIELFSEWGHRWLDLKRTGNADALMSAVTPTKGGNWSPNWQLYPIPFSEIRSNPNLKQNDGY
jgi:hypothetical protein